MKLNICILLFITMLLLTGCAVRTADAPKEPSPIHHNTTSQTYNIETKGPDTFHAEVTTHSDGVIGVPSGNGSFPLILIVYGAPSKEESFIQDNYDFADLVGRLARNGYVAVSLDISSAFTSTYADRSIRNKAIAIASQHMQLLQAANAGTNSAFEIDLTRKIDFSRIGLCGYAQGGDLIFDIALDLQHTFASDFALLPIAPIKSVDIEKKTWPKGQVSILIPTSDGNTCLQDSLAIDTLVDTKTESLHSSTILMNANALLTLPEQQHFVMHYALDFYNAALKGQTKETIYAPDAPAPTQMYGYDVLCRLGKNGKRVLTNADSSNILTTDNCIIRTMQDSWFHADDQIPIDTLTFGNYGFKQRDLLHIQWQTIDASISFQPENKDLRGYSILSLRIITDPLDPLNNGLKGQSLTVVLKDGKGNSSAVTLSDCPNALRTAPSLQDPSTDFVTPLMSTDLLLTAFRHVALNDIVSVELRFDQSNSGSVYLERILLQ